MRPNSSPTPTSTSSPTPTPVPAGFDPDDDDHLIGRVLSRREVLALMGLGSISVVAAACAPGSVASTAAATAGASAANGAASSGATGTAAASGSAVAVASGLPSCVVVPELTEGPYYVNENLDRSDIRVDTSTGKAVDGSVLTIDWVVSKVDGNACIPLEGVLVDVWHCDALGNYSDVGSEQGHDFLRGYQHTDASGKATITTIYPGWYQGRAVHIHFKVRTDATGTSGFVFTSQLFFDDALNAEVFSQGVYASKGAPDVKNGADGIYQQSQGMTLLKTVKAGSGSVSGSGYKATFEIALRTA